MSNEDLKDVIKDLGTAFHEFKAENDTRLKEIEKKGKADPLLNEKVDKINAELTALSNMKKQMEAIETAVARSQHPGGGNAEVNKAKAEHKAAFNAWFRKGIDNGLKDLEIKAAASTLSDPDGGFTVPEEVDKAIDRVALTVSAMRRLSTVRTISTDTYKKLIGVGGATSGWVGEKAARAETNTPTLREIAINAKEIYANPAATQTLLDDSAIDVGAWLADEAGIEFNEEESSAFITGNGVEKPMGIGAYTMVANASYAWGKVGFITSGHATLINNADKFITLQHALKTSYRNGSSFLMNDTTLASIRYLKDGNGNYMFVPGLTAGAAETLLGKPIEVDDNVADIGANTYPVFYGNFKRAYTIIDRQGTRVLRDPYTNKPFVHFYTTKRVGGGITMFEAIKALKVAV